MVMMSNLASYIEEAISKGMTKIIPTIEIEDEDEGGRFISKCKEVYTIGSESEADALIEAATQDNNCCGHDKKFKQGKVDKNGNETRPDLYVVTIKYSL